MSNIFLSVQGIGRLYIKETLVRYDTPLIFVCEDDYDSLYLFHEIKDDNDEIEWEAVKITRQTYHDILASKISLIHVFKQKQSTPFLLIKYFYDEESTELNESYDLHCPEILKGKETYVKDFEVTDSNELDLELELYPGKAVECVAIDIQTDLCMQVRNIVKNRGENSQYLDAALGIPKAASYSIPIVITSSSAETISAVKVTKDLATLINSSSGSESLIGEKELVLNSLKKIYESIQKTDSDIILTYIDESTQEKVLTRIDKTEYKMRSAMIASALRQCERVEEIPEDIKTITGALIAFNVKDASYKIRVSADEEYSGKIVPELKEKSFKVGTDTIYKAEIKRKDKKKYLLLSLQDLQPPLF